MKEHIEREVKLALQATDYHALIHLFTQEFAVARILQQTNRFFDSDDDVGSDNGVLRQARCSLRLRQENQDCILTIKHKHAQLPQIGSLHQHLEYEQRVHHALWPALVHNHVAIDQVVGLHPCIHQAQGTRELRCIGGFCNQRHLWHIQIQNSHAEICLDRTKFANGHIDYELEIESSEAEKVAATIHTLLTQWNIQTQPQRETKMARFLQHKNC